ncbi:MAG: tetratricopeptide repeat protein [Flavobacteriales bacterium]|nr:tetratricopeptide repeat protein [Flavobacteriales bacterium]
MCVLEDIYKRHSGNSPEQAAVKCLETGKEHLAKGEYKTALKYFDQASRHPQTAPEAFDNKMQALFAMELYDSASKSIDAALKEFPENTVAYNYKALLYAKDKKWDEAIDCCDMIIGIRPSSEDAYIAKSELLVKKGDYKKACEAAKDALSINPDSERANFQAAKAFFGLKEYDKAISLFGKVVGMNPGNATARTAKKNSLDMYRRTEKNELKLALMLMDNKMYADSLRHFENMLSDGEDTAELHYFLGKVYKGLGDTDRMIESMQRAFELAPYSTAPYIEIGEELISQGRPRDAMEYFDKVLEIDPMNRIANIRKGGFLRSEGLVAQAEECYDKLLSENNKDAEAYLLKGITAIDRYPVAGNPTLYFDKAMEINPMYALPMYYRGKFQILSGQKRHYALESFNKAAFLASMSKDEDLLEKCREAIKELCSKADN